MSIIISVAPLAMMSAGLVQDGRPSVGRHRESSGPPGKDISTSARGEPEGESREECPKRGGHPASGSREHPSVQGDHKRSENNNINNCTSNNNYNQTKHGPSQNGDAPRVRSDAGQVKSSNPEKGAVPPPHDGGEAMDTVGDEVPRRGNRARELRNAHARSEILTSELYRRRSASMMEVKEQAYGRLQEELDKAQQELKLKDEECGKLSKVRNQMCLELEDLTASLFEEANNMVQEANIKRMHAEKLFIEADDKIEVLQAEVLALKQLVLTSTPSTPNKHLHPQIEAPKKKESRPFWKGHRRSTSHHEFTKESRQEEEERQKEPVRIVEMDAVCYMDFGSWRQDPQLARSCQFLSRVVFEDIGPCLNFSSKELSERVQQCVETNTLMIEPISGDSSFPRKCSLSDSSKLCNFKIKLGDDTRWYPISQHCRNRIASVCDFYSYIRYIHQGLVKNEDKDVFNEIVRLRRQMALCRLGLL